ncbi:MAG TPA: type II secretion system protein GspL [Geobacteraceae bacterium]
MNYLIVQLLRHEAVVARFARRRGELVFLAAARQPLDAPHELPPLRQGLPAATAEERVILALPPAELFLRELELPIADRRKLREVVPFELKGETALEDEELVFDALPLAEGKALAVWGREREVGERIRLLAEQRLEPEIVTVSSCHWEALLAPADRPGSVAITDGEALAVFRDGNLVFSRPLVSAEPATEVVRTLTILELDREIAVRRVLLHGEAAREMTRYAVAGGDTLEWLPLPVAGELATAFPGDAAAALDLAGAYAAAAAMQQGAAINLRTGTLAYTAGRARARRKLRLTALLATLALLLVCGEAGLRYYLVKRDVDSLNRSIGAIYREVFPSRKKPVDEVAELRSEIKRLGGGAAGSSVLVVLKKVAEVKGDDVSDIYEAEIEGDQVRLKGDARSIQAVNDFKTRAAAQFGSVDVGEIKSRPDGSVSFVFHGTLTEGKK